MKNDRFIIFTYSGCWRCLTFVYNSLHFLQNSANSIYRTQTSYNPTPGTNKVHSSLKTIEAVSRFHITQHTLPEYKLQQKNKQTRQVSSGNLRSGNIAFYLLTIYYTDSTRIQYTTSGSLIYRISICKYSLHVCISVSTSKIIPIYDL